MESAKNQEMGEGGGECEGAVAKGDGEDVDREPKIAAQNGDKGIQGRIEDGGLEVGSNEGEDDHGGSGQQIDGGAMTGGKKDGEEAGPESNPKDAFIHVGHGGSTGDPDAGGKTGDKEEEPQMGKIPAPREEAMFWIPSCDQKENRGKKPGDPGPAEGMKFQVGDFELDFETGKIRILLLFDKLVEGKRSAGGGPGSPRGGTVGGGDDAKCIAGYEGGKKP